MVGLKVEVFNFTNMFIFYVIIDEKPFLLSSLVEDWCFLKEFWEKYDDLSFKFWIYNLGNIVMVKFESSLGKLSFDQIFNGFFTGGVCFRDDWACRLGD